MAKYIDKDALLVEIEKAIKIIYAGREYVGIPYSEECIVYGLQKAEDIINTFEVKEVDLEKEIEIEWNKSNPIDEGMGVESAYIHIEAFDMIAKHFYSLGLAQKKE